MWFEKSPPPDIDQWQITFSRDELLEFKSEKIEELLSKIKHLKSRLSAYKVDYKVKCPDKESIISLMLQLRNLEDTDGNQVFKCPGPFTWAKIISNHFETDKAIPFDTALNYLRGKSTLSKNDLRVQMQRKH